jgi:hypothetical protein
MDKFADNELCILITPEFPETYFGEPVLKAHLVVAAFVTQNSIGMLGKQYAIWGILATQEGITTQKIAFTRYITQKG